MRRSVAALFHHSTHLPSLRVLNPKTGEGLVKDVKTIFK